jgi:hypothetical protein
MEGFAEDEGFERDHLVVLMEDNAIRSIEDMIKVLLTFWHAFLEENSAYKDLKSPEDVEREF